LQFPHHECEVAQTESLTGKPMAKYWMHNGYIHINNEKMSKSLGNGINVRQLLASVKPQVLRYFMLSTHYRNPLHFSDESLKQAEGALARMENCISNLRYRLRNAGEGPADPRVEEKIREIERSFREKMDDDFNTPDAITAMFELVTEANIYMQGEIATQATLNRILDSFALMNGVLGILSGSSEELLDEEIERLIAERAEARKMKNWARADEIRELLAKRNIILEDTPQGVRWRRK